MNIHIILFLILIILLTCKKKELFSVSSSVSDLCSCKPNDKGTEAVPIIIDIASDWSNIEMRNKWNEINESLPRNEELVCHYTEKRFAEMIIGKGSNGLRASTVGQLGGGLSVCLDGPHKFGWDRYGGKTFYTNIGKALWGSKWKNVLPGNVDHNKLECCLWIRIPRHYILQHRIVPNRPSVLIIPFTLLNQVDNANWLNKNRIVKAYNFQEKSSVRRPKRQKKSFSTRKTKGRRGRVAT